MPVFSPLLLKVCLIQINYNLVFLYMMDHIEKRFFFYSLSCAPVVACISSGETASYAWPCGGRAMVPERKIRHVWPLLIFFSVARRATTHGTQVHAADAWTSSHSVCIAAIPPWPWHISTCISYSASYMHRSTSSSTP
jgi:hypothetical protein